MMMMMMMMMMVVVVVGGGGGDDDDDEGDGDDDDDYDSYVPRREPIMDTLDVNELVFVASVPYSGNHLTRRLIEAATARPTYSIYQEDGLFAKELAGFDKFVSTSAKIERSMSELGLKNYRPRGSCDAVVLKTHFPYSP